MNYWPRWINAIQRHTASLSLAQMGAYDRLLDHFFDLEKPLPLDLVQCYRICGAQTNGEREAVRFVLANYFEKTDDGYTQQRALEELHLGRQRIAAAQENGKKGGRPKGTKNKPTGFSSGNQPGSPAATHGEPAPKAHHLHSNQEGASSPSPPAHAPAPADAHAHTRARGSWREELDHEAIVEGHTPNEYGKVAWAIRRAGIGSVNTGHLEFRQLVDAGATAEEFLAYVDKAKDKDNPFAYLITTVGNERRRLAKTAGQLLQGPLPAREPMPPNPKAESFRERDERAAAARYAEMVGKPLAGALTPADPIDITPTLQLGAPQ